jgi:putative oxidoreductase
MYDFSLLAYFLLRVVSGLLMSCHGAQKMFGSFGGMPGMTSPPPFPSQIWFGGVIELTGGVLILLGLYTRCAAFILSGTMAVAYFQFHAKDGFWPIVNHGELAVLFCFVFLFISTKGGGMLSLDGRFRDKQTRPAA